MPDVLERGLALHTRAVTEQNIGRPARALLLLNRALAAIEGAEDGPAKADLFAALWISVGYNQAECVDVDSGLNAVDVGLQAAADSSNPRRLGEAYAQRAGINQRAGRIEAATNDFAQVAAYQSHLGTMAQFSYLLNFGNLRMMRGELGAAMKLFADAAALARASDLPTQEFKALHNRGYAEFLSGDLPLALRHMEECLSLDAEISLAVPLLDRARVLSEAGLVSEADRCLAEAIEMFRRDRTFHDLGDAELERARCALLLDDPQLARKFAGRARDRFRRRGNAQFRRTAELVLLQADLAGGRPGKRLIGPAVRLRDELSLDGLRGPARTAALITVEANLAAGLVEAASRELEHVGRESKQDPITTRLHAHHVRARVDLARGQRLRAASRVSRALTDLANYQSTFGSVDLSTAAAVHGRRLADLDIEIAVGSGRAESIFDASERGRAVTHRLSAIRPPEDEVTAGLLAELRQVVESLRAVELNARASGPLVEQRRELEGQIAKRAWTRAGEGAVGEVVALPEVKAKLDAEATTLVSFVLAGTRLIGVVAGPGGVRYEELGPFAPVAEHIRRIRADLDVLAQPRLPAPVASAVLASFNRSAATFDDALIRPLGLEGRLVLVTTGLLGAVPWNLLPSLRGEPVTVAPSATAWAANATRRRAEGEHEVVAVAGPGLARSDDEAIDVAKAWGNAQLLSGGDATSASLTTAMSSARLVHVAAHGTHQSENPLFSSLRLSDGPLFAHELDQTAGTPEHVVLSACELGLATVRPGDEALGLTSVLLRLGTTSVVAGVARIGDDLAAETMGRYHRLLAGGQDSASALADAVAAVDHPVPLVNFGATWRR